MPQFTAPISSVLYAHYFVIISITSEWNIRHSACQNRSIIHLVPGDDYNILGAALLLYIFHSFEFDIHDAIDDKIGIYLTNKTLEIYPLTTGSDYILFFLLVH